MVARRAAARQGPVHDRRRGARGTTGAEPPSGRAAWPVRTLVERPSRTPPLVSIPPPVPPPSDSTLQQQLEAAADGLVYSSEGDHPFAFVALGAPPPHGPPSADWVAARLGVPAGTPVRERSLDRFLAHHLDATDPWDDRAQALRPRYERLVALLRVRLVDVRVFCVGEVRIDCYLVGRADDGGLVGLHTVAIET
jgi:hypothetical protein